MVPPANPGPPLPPEDPLPPGPPPPPPVTAEADDAGRRRAQAELDAALLGLQAARLGEAALVQRLVIAQAAVAAAETRLVAEGAEAEALGRELARARSRLRNLAVTSYVGGAAGPTIRFLVGAKDAVDLARRADLIAIAAQVHRSAVDDYRSAHVAASAELEDEVAALQAAVAEHGRVLVDVAAAASRVHAFEAQVEERRLLLESATASAPVGPSDIPRLFLDAYRRAAAAQGQRAPECRVSWPMLAGLGKVESNHAQRSNVKAALNGDVVPRIAGIPLDGTRGTRLIRDTDGGLLDGDPVYDRAVGPMQFIPSTWKTMGQDGNGDGRSDPNNIYDAALAAGGYLCRAARDGGLDREDQLRRAVYAYNASASYVEKVLGHVRGYEALAGQLAPLPAG